MNTLEMYGVCHEIYRDYRGLSTYEPVDETILNAIFRLYNTTDIDTEEIKDLWIEYLTKGSLSISDMVQRARMRNYRTA